MVVWLLMQKPVSRQIHPHPGLLPGRESEECAAPAAAACLAPSASQGEGWGQGGRRLDDLPGIHQRHAMRHALDHSQVVRDQQHAHAALALKILEQVQDLRLTTRSPVRTVGPGHRRQQRPPWQRRGICCCGKSAARANDAPADSGADAGCAIVQWQRQASGPGPFLRCCQAPSGIDRQQSSPILKQGDARALHRAASPRQPGLFCLRAPRCLYSVPAWMTLCAAAISTC